MSSAELCARDGNICRICSDAVDMDAPLRDMWAPSVDHIIPRAAGGSDDPSNLQLAHLWCNQVKNRRIGFTLIPA